VGKVDGEFLGCCGLLPKETPRTPEVGIWIKKGAQGRKYGREAVETLAAWAKASLDLEYLVYPVDKANAPSRKIPEALGGVLLHEMQVCKPNGETLDLVVYKIHPSADSAI
jgi:RimJ/RimL family protein N-acetyltransferase